MNIYIIKGTVYVIISEINHSWRTDRKYPIGVSNGLNNNPHFWTGISVVFTSMICGSHKLHMIYLYIFYLKNIFAIINTGELTFRLYRRARDTSLNAFWETSTSFKSKIENNWDNWEGAFYQSEWVKINSSLVILEFSLYVYCC